MKLEVFQEFSFEAARRLTALGDAHPCGRLHGHSFKVELRAEGPLDPQLGWVVDFKELMDAFEPLHKQLDHACLNEVPGLENPTSEHLALWIWERIKPRVPQLTSVVVRDAPGSGCRCSET